jgi:V/A-type H+-transporting ATPase subunit A
VLRKGNDIKQMMAVVGEEGTTVEDFTVMLKAEFFDSVFLQQNAFDDVDAATPADRQRLVFDTILDIVNLDFQFESAEEARQVMVQATDLFRNWNYMAADDPKFKKTQAQIEEFLAKKGRM